MSSLHQQPIWHSDPKGQAIKNRRYFLLASSLIGTALILTLLVTAASFHPTGVALVAPRETSLMVRSEYPVSTFVYSRGFFSWFIGIAGSAVVGAAIAFSGIGPACVAGGPVGVGGCVLAAVASVAAVAAIASTRAQQTEAKLMRQKMIYMEPVDKSSKREINHVEQYFSELYGVDDYRYHGYITADDKFNRHLIEQNNGEHVPVFSFTTPHGIKFHHAIVYRDDGSEFHRFGFPAAVPKPKRTTIYAEYADNEYFTSGGIDSLNPNGIDNGNDQYLNTGDYSKMQTELYCADSSLTSLGEFGVQIYDATTEETIGFATIAPVQADGDTVLFSGTKYSPPLTQGNNCAKQTSSD